MSAADLSAIVEAARRNNTAREITGMLCHYDGSFLQFLEGEEDVVDEVFSKIKGDPRHRQILEVDRRPIEARLFPDWSMAVVRPGEISPAQQAFCTGLRELEIGADAPHRSAIEGFLTAFRTWMR
jgi:hypothetical protein